MGSGHLVVQLMEGLTSVVSQLEGWIQLWLLMGLPTHGLSDMGVVTAQGSQRQHSKTQEVEAA